jgi:hypothetical protein
MEYTIKANTILARKVERKISHARLSLRREVNIEVGDKEIGPGVVDWIELAKEMVRCRLNIVTNFLIQ